MLLPTPPQARRVIEGYITLGRGPEQAGWTYGCPDACSRHSDQMDGLLAAPFCLNPTALGVREEEEALMVQEDQGCGDMVSLENRPFRSFPKSRRCQCF